VSERVEENEKGEEEKERRCIVGEVEKENKG
jgi:hypothetical protein